MLSSVIVHLKFSVWGSETCGVTNQRERIRGNGDWSFPKQLFKLSRKDLGRAFVLSRL